MNQMHCFRSRRPRVVLLDVFVKVCVVSLILLLTLAIIPEGRYGFRKLTVITGAVENGTFFTNSFTTSPKIENSSATLKVPIAKNNDLYSDISSEAPTGTTIRFPKEITNQTIQTTLNVHAEEMNQRRASGYLDNIPVSLVLKTTNFLRLPTPPCISRLKMIILVSSACKNVNIRNAIRESWGKQSVQMNVPVVFFVGQCPTIAEEFLMFHDIVEADFVDSYYNLTIKTLTRMRWYKELCNNSELVFMADDDSVPYTKNILRDLTEPIGFTAMCELYSNLPIVRDRQSQWYVPEWALPGELYPPYCFGHAYLINASAIELLFIAVLEMKFIGIEDALFTGYAAEKIGLERKNEERFVGMTVKSSLSNEEVLFASHGYSEKEIIKLGKIYF